MSPDNGTAATANSPIGGPHGHTGPTTPAEQASGEATLDAVPAEDRIRIAEEASRQEDA